MILVILLYSALTGIVIEHSSLGFVEIKSLLDFFNNIENDNDDCALLATLNYTITCVYF